MPDQKVADEPTLLQQPINWDKLGEEKKTLGSKKDGLEARLSKIGDILDDKIGIGDGTVKSLLMHIVDRWETQPDSIMMLARVLAETSKIQKELHVASSRLHLITSFQSDHGWFSQNFLDQEPAIANATDDILQGLEQVLSNLPSQPEDIPED